MRIIATAVYSFDELSKEAQEKAIETVRNDHEVYLDDTVEEIKEELETLGFINPSIWYDLSYSQWSGAVFDCKSIDIEKLAQSVWISPTWIDKIQIGINSTFYNHERTRYTDVFFEEGKYSRDTENKIEEFRLSKCKEIKKRLQEEYDFKLSDDSIKSIIECNWYEFLESWKLI